MKEEYANYDYQTITAPLKNDLGITIGKEIKQSFKLCTKDCKYKTNWKELKKWLEEEQDRLARECSSSYEYGLGKTRLVNEDIYNELKNISDKKQELENKNENN